jgi:hypothetical protein
MLLSNVSQLAMDYTVFILQKKELFICAAVQTSNLQISSNEVKLPV